jgi:predicted O-methyltransferase YrrM
MNTARQKLLKAKHELRMAWKRYLLSSRNIPSGLGQSGWALHGLVRAMRPEVCVEIGSAHGWSTCLIALALEQNIRGKLYAVDPHVPNDWTDPNPEPEKSLDALIANLNAVGVAKRVQILRKTTAQAKAELPEHVDFAFIDGDHSFHGVKTDWEVLQPRLAPWSIVVFHDSLWEVHRGVPLYEQWRSDKMGVPLFLETLREEGYPLVTIDADWGLTMVQADRGSAVMVPTGQAR